MEHASSATRVAPRLTLVLGGARSGKSRYAEGLVGSWHGSPFYLATAQPLDDEMRHRIAQHRARRGAAWTTVEEPLALPSVLRETARRGVPILVDCLTLWLSNVICAGRPAADAIDALVAAVPQLAAPVVMVANEVGLGIVPENELARAFRDEAGRLNCELAHCASRVVFIAAGLPLVLKDEGTCP